MPLAELDRLDARELAALIASRAVSPVEVVKRAFDRLDETESALNAFVSVDRDAAMSVAKLAESSALNGDDLGPLHGVPVSVKDLIDVKGLPCKFGSLAMADYRPRHDAPSVGRLRAAGAIIIGKTSTSEFGYRAYTKSRVHGNTANPWNTRCTPGGSSGGAAASVAGGVTSIALGTDGGGSVRGPAALTGLVGLKATFGRVPVWPASATPTLAHVGPIARSVSDAAELLRLIAGADFRDPFSLYPAIGRDTAEASVRELRVAYAPTMGYGSVDADVRECFDKSIQLLRSVWPDMELVQHVCPDPATIFRAEFIGGCSARLDSVLDTAPDKIDPPLLEAIKKFREMGSGQYTRLLRQRSDHREVLRSFFERYDLLLTPTTPCVAWDIELPTPPGHESAPVWSYFTYPFNLGHQPAGTLPCGLTSRGMPAGLQFVTQMLGEPTLIAAMLVAERTLGRPVRTPVEPSEKP